MEPEPIAVAIKVAHRLIGISRSKFYELLAAGEIRSIKCGRRRLVLVQSLREYLQRGGT
jgi:excisionase family DNA binding protein